jgi:hypothetical protein
MPKFQSRKPGDENCRMVVQKAKPTESQTNIPIPMHAPATRAPGWLGFTG